MVNQDYSENPGGGSPKRYSESLPLQGYSPCGWNSAQYGQGPDASSIIPRDPCCWIRLFQSYDLRHHHWNKGGHEPERRGNSAKRHVEHGSGGATQRRGYKTGSNQPLYGVIQERSSLMPNRRSRTDRGRDRSRDSWGDS